MTNDPKTLIALSAKANARGAPQPPGPHDEAAAEPPGERLRPRMHATPPAGQGDAAGLDRDSFSATALAEIMDRATHASIAKLTFGLSPASLIGAYFDWLIHLTAAPGKQMQLVRKALRTKLKR